MQKTGVTGMGQHINFITNRDQVGGYNFQRVDRIVSFN